MCIWKIVLLYCDKENHAEKAFSVTTIGFEIKIMDKCCVVVNSHGSGVNVWTWHNKSISTPEAVPQSALWPIHGKKKSLTWGHFLFFCHMPVCSRDILLDLYLVIILPYVCSRVMLQLFDKALIVFSFENMFQIHTECIYDCLFLSEYKSYLSTLRICACISYQNTVDLKGLQIPVGLNECCMTEQSSVC